MSPSLSQGQLNLSIVIVSFNTRDLTCKCIQSIIDNTHGITYEIILIDNNSQDSTVESALQAFPSIKIIQNYSNVGFSAANNQGINIAGGDYILLLNSDTIVLDDSITKLTSYARYKGLGCAVAPILLNQDFSLQQSFYQFPNLPKIILNATGLSPLVKNLLCLPVLSTLTDRLFPLVNLTRSADSLPYEFTTDYVLFAAIMLPTSLIKEVGPLDENMPFYHEDCEYGYRLATKGKAIWVYSDAKIIHLGGGSSRSVTKTAYRNYFVCLIYFYKKHYSLLSNLLLIFFVKALFILKIVFALFNRSTYLYIPSNYKQSPSVSVFTGKSDRIKYYIDFLSL